jgi:creatinine amidohydrolase
MTVNSDLLWAEMTPDRFVAAVSRCPVAYVPLGLLEWHGDHLPLGTDFLKISGIALAAASRTGGVVLPPIYIGRPGFGSFAGTMTFSEDLVYKLLAELFEQLQKCGFKVIVVLTGHYGPVQVNLVKRAAADYSARTGLAVIAQPEYEGIDPPPADHAGKWETSFSQALYPHLVHMDAFSPGECPIERYDARWAAFDAEHRPWIWREDLRDTASAEAGQEMIGRIVDRLAGLVTAALSTSGPPDAGART